MEKIFNSLNLCLFYLSKKRQKHNNTWINYLTSTLIHVIENITFRNWQVMHVIRCFFVCPNVVVGNKIIVMFCYYIVLVSHFLTKPVDCRLCVILEFSWLIKYHFLLCLLNQFNMIYIHVVWLNFNMFWLVAKLLKHSVPVTYVESFIIWFTNWNWHDIIWL